MTNASFLDGGAITKRRIELGLTQAVCAARAKVQSQRWSDIESGRFSNPQLSTVMLVASVLELASIDTLIVWPKKRRPAKKGT